LLVYGGGCFGSYDLLVDGLGELVNQPGYIGVLEEKRVLGGDLISDAQLPVAGALIELLDYRRMVQDVGKSSLAVVPPVRWFGLAVDLTTTGGRANRGRMR
jgi:hypothetical protein